MTLDLFTGVIAFCLFSFVSGAPFYEADAKHHLWSVVNDSGIFEAVSSCI